MAALDNIVEQLAKRTARASKNRAAIVTVNEAAVAQSKGTINAQAQQLLDEYQAFQGQIDIGTGKTLQEMQTAAEFVARDDLLRRTSQREAKLFSKEEDVDYTFQTSNSEEFSRRLRQQLDDPEFSMTAIMDNDMSTAVLANVKMSQQINKRFQENMGFSFFTDRVNDRATAWMGDSPYVTNGQPRVFVHVDRQTDPIRAQGDLVQFEFPRELGVHSGTNQAAIQATIKSPTNAMQQIEAFDKLLDEVAGFSDNPKNLKRVFTQTIERFFVQKFSQGDIYSNDMWDELLGILQPVINDLGGGPGAGVSVYIGRAKQLPTANSTPHLFRGRNGLFLRDEGGFGAETVGKQLFNIFPEQADQIEAAMGAGSTVEKNKSLQQFIESQGYDHVVYHNAVEDRGTLSIINWNKNLWVSLYDEQIVGTSPSGYGKAVTAMIMGSLGLGAGNAELRN